MAITFTAEMRTPAKMVGRANGSSTWRMICPSDRPIPRAESTISRSTWRMPTNVLVRIGGIASSTSASITFVKPVPR